MLLRPGYLLGSQFSGALAPILDGLTAPSAAWGAIRLLTTYTGPLASFVRASDSATIDIGYSRNNKLDIATLAAWGAGTTVAVTQWWDQTGGGNHAVQATTASQPQWYNISINGIPTLAFGAAGTEFMVASALASGSTRSFSMLLAGRIQLSNFNHGLIDAGNSVVMANENLKLLLNGTSGAQTTNFRTQTSPIVQTFASGSILKVGVNGVFQNMSQVTLNLALPAGVTLGYYAAVTQASHVDAVCMGMWSSQLSDANAALLHSRLMAILNIPTTVNDQVVLMGDSITYGYTATDLTGWSTLIQPKLNRNSRFATNAVVGQTINTAMITAGPSQVDGWYDPALRNNLTVLFGGTNDIVANGSTGVATLGFANTYCAARRSAGWGTGGSRIAVVTMLPRTTKESDRITYNQGLVANALGNWDFVFDIASDPNMGQAGQCTNLTYYQADQVHPNDNGYAYLASIMAPMFNAAMV
jgi:lysophospholipase L1-like esterase